MKNFSTISLIAANSVPFFGVLLLGWSLFSVMFFYWLETIVIVLYTFLKMTKAEEFEEKSGRLPYKKSNHISSFASYISFIGFYSFVIYGHGVLIFSIYGPSDITIFKLITGLTLFFISHGISYFENFIGKKEYERVSPSTLWGQPVKRLLFMHLTIIFCGFVIIRFNSPAAAILVLVIVKTIIDLHSHKRERKKFSGADETSKMGIFKDEEIIKENSSDLSISDISESTKESIVREAIRKTPWLSLTMKNISDMRTKDSPMTKEELQQKMNSVMTEFQQNVKSELEKNNNKIPCESEDTQR